MISIQWFDCVLYVISIQWFDCVLYEFYPRSCKDYEPFFERTLSSFFHIFNPVEAANPWMCSDTYRAFSPLWKFFLGCRAFSLLWSFFSVVELFLSVVDICIQNIHELYTSLWMNKLENLWKYQMFFSAPCKTHINMISRSVANREKLNGFSFHCWRLEWVSLAWMTVSHTNLNKSYILLLTRFLFRTLKKRLLYRFDGYKTLSGVFLLPKTAVP